MSITSVHLRNFKCFRDFRLPLGGLTLLTGYNAAGKSTALQGLLLLTQALRSGRSDSVLALSGPLVRLGMPGDVITANADTRTVQITVSSQDADATWRLEPTELAVGYLGIAEAVVVAGNERIMSKGTLWPDRVPSAATELKHAVSDLVYISAVRAGASDIFPVPDSADTTHADVGTEGEYAPWWFSHLGDYEVHEARRHDSEEGHTFRRQLDAYLGDLFPGAEANSEYIKKTSVVRLEFRTKLTGEWHRPANIGYGLTYAFPILVALLAARPGQIIAIDSPEAHLHPRAQSAMGRLLARFAAAGVHVVVETHSDHILNGVRLAVRDGVIGHSKVAVNFFAGANGDGHGVASLSVDRAGNIDDWPQGFFDQSERDLARLAGWD